MSKDITKLEENKQSNINIIYSAYAMVSLLNGLIASDYLNSEQFKDLDLGKNSTGIKKVLKDVSLGNQATLLSCLYQYLVLPKELILLPKEQKELCNRRIKELVGDNCKKHFYTYPKDSDNIDFLRHIRNSISHGRVTFDNEKFLFKDMYSEESNFELILTKTEVGNLLQILENELIMFFIRSIQESDLK